MNYEELKAKASKGPFKPAINAVVFSNDGEFIAGCNHDRRPVHVRQANAQLIAHCLQRS